MTAVCRWEPAPSNDADSPEEGADSPGTSIGAVAAERILDINHAARYDAMMRTTLTIDDDIALRIEQQRQRDGQSLKQVINRLLREGLRHDQRPSEARKYRTKTHKLRMRPGFDAARLNRLADELETEAHLEREARFRG